jgi:hypothetical protein
MLYSNILLFTLTDISIRGQPNYRFLKDDKVHLNGYGIKVFVSNLKYSLRKILNIQKHVQVGWLKQYVL